jgi:hypothetical protein
MPERGNEGRETWASSPIPWKNYWVWRAGKLKSSGSSDQSVEIGGGTRVIRTRAARHTFTQRLKELRSMLTLVPHFTLDQPHLKRERYQPHRSSQERIK